MPQYVDYDATSLYIDPTALAQSATRLKNCAQEVADSVSAINRTLSSLALGWVGKSQQEAETMNHAWTTTMRGLFGTEDAPGNGVLNVMAGGTLAVAAGNAQTELALADMYVKFLGGISGGGGGGSSSPPPDITDLNNTAITADW